MNRARHYSFLVGYERDGETGLDYAQNRYYGSMMGRFTSVDPFNIILETQGADDEEKAHKQFVSYISEPQRWNRYAYVLNNPLKYVDPDGLDALVVAFTDYRISVGGVRVPELGHAGIVIIDDDGKTTYYEYGRYDSEQRGQVREFDVPDLVMGSDGRPTEESLNNLMQNLSQEHGQGGTVSGAYYDTDQDLTNSMRSYAEGRENQNPSRESYALTSRNCMTFTKDVLDAGGVALRNSGSSPRPNGEIEYMRGGSYSVYGRTSNPGTPIYRPPSKGTTPAPNDKKVGS